MDVTGVETVRYIRGINLIKSDKSGFYLFNAHGDVVQLADTNGTVTRVYRYDAFGVEKEPEPGDQNPFRYCAEYFDKETGSVYLRARYYEPRTGRFRAEDPVRDGLNWYTYAGSNPICFIDPLGLYFIPLRDTVNGRNDLYTNIVWDEKTSTATVTMAPLGYSPNANPNVVNEWAKYVITYKFKVGVDGAYISNGRMYVDDAIYWNAFYKLLDPSLLVYDRPQDIAAMAGAIITFAKGKAIIDAGKSVVAGVASLFASSAGVPLGTEFGKLGTLVQNPNITVNWSITTTHGMQRMAERGVTQSMVEQWVQTGKVLGQAGDKFLYITQQGAAVVNRAGQVITAYSSELFDSNMLDVVRHLFGE